LIWAIVHPYRVTLLHPRGQGFWWLFVEPPLLVVIAGAVFTLVVARPLLTDLEARDAAAR
jgi:ABC-type polysaccharide/polyol phosphate export permease